MRTSDEAQALSSHGLAPAPHRSPGASRRLAQGLAHDPVAAVAVACVLAFLLLAVAAPILPLSDPLQIDLGARLDGPTASHLLGADETGRDTLSRLAWGARPALYLALVPALVGAFIGTAIGLAASWHAGIDAVSMRIVDTALAFPGLLLAIVVATGFGNGVSAVFISLAAVTVPRFARLVRAEALVESSKDYVTAARTLGAGEVRVMLGHVLPNLATIVVTVYTLEASRALIIASSLSFLGIGVAPPDPDWGAMLAEGRKVMLTAPQLILVPGAAIFLVSLSLNVLGDALVDIMDPVQRGR